MEVFGMFWRNWRIYFSEEATRGLLDAGFCPNSIDVFNRFQSQCSFHFPSILICSEKFCVILWYKRKGRILFIHVHLLWVINPNYVGIEWSWYDVWVSCGYGRNHGHL